VTGIIDERLGKRQRRDAPSPDIPAILLTAIDAADNHLPIQ